MQALLIRSLIVTLLGTAGGVAAGQAAAAEPASALVDRLFDPQRVVDIQIKLEPADWDRLRFQSRSISEALQKKRPESPFKYVRGSVTIDGITVSEVGIRKKGFLGSLDETRPSLKIRFDKYVEQAPFGDLDRLTLNNNKQDASQLGQFLGYQLFRDTGTPAPRCNFAKVTVNGQSLGIYSNVESVKPAFLRRHFQEDSGVLVEGTLADLAPEMIDQFELKTRGADLADLAALAAILAADELDRERLESLLDIDAFVRFWALESLIGFWDGYSNNQNNFFIYQHPASGKHYFMPWGLDSAFTYAIPVPPFQIEHKSVHSQSVLANRLYRDAVIRERYRQTLTKFLAEHWNEERLLAEVDRVELLLADHVHLDAAAFRRAVRKFRSFITGRRQVLQAELEQWPIALATGPKDPTYARLIGQGRAVFSTQWYAATPSNPETRGELEMQLTFGEQPVVFRQLGVIAEPNKDRRLAVDGQRPPSLVLTGLREPDGKRLTLALGMDANSFQPSDQPVAMMGVLIEGNPLWFLAQAMLNPSGLTLIEGRATFERAAMEVGAPVQGEVRVKLMKIIGGQAKPVAWQNTTETQAE